MVIDYGTGARAPSGSSVTLATPTGAPVGVVLVDDETGDIEVPSSWGLAPSGLSVGDDFRLLFRTSRGRDATSSDIADYDAFVRGVLADAGHADIKPYAGFFKVFGSTLDAQNTGAGGTSARVHNGLASVHTGHHDGNSDMWTDDSTRATVGDAAGVPTYWLNGAILANNYADLCDINWSGGNGVTTGWDTDDPRSEDGTRNIPTGAISDYGPYSTWTGSGNACEAWNHPLGASTVSRSSADSGGGQSLLHQSPAANTGTHPFYGYSPVFKLVAAPSEVTVAPDWALIPSGISVGGKFRLLFVTSTQRDASATDIATYNTFVQNRAAAGHTAIRAHSAEFRVVGSTASLDARDNSATTGTGVPIYWLGGSNSNRVADNYADFYDGNWDSYVNTNENGAGSGNATVWTGSNNNGTRHSSNPLGATNVQYGQLFLASTNAPFTRSTSGNSNSRHLYGLSPVYTVQAAVVVPELTFSSATYSGAEDGGTISVTVNASSAPMSALTVNLGKTDGTAQGGGVDFTNPAATFTFPASVTSHAFTVSITDDMILENHEDFTLTLQSGTGYTVGTTQPSTTVTITDQDSVTVRIEDATDTVSEDDEGVTITVLKDGDADIPVQATLTPSDGTATGGSDATVAGIDYDHDPVTPITIPAGVSSVDLLIAINDDSVAEPSETFTVALTVVGGQRGVSLGSPSTSTVTITDNDAPTATVPTNPTVPIDWALKPADIEQGESFRLLFVTSTTHQADSNDIAFYDNIVQTRAKDGHSAISDDIGDQFKLLGSTASVDARDNTGTTGTGVPIYWLNGEKVADDYPDFYDGTWDSSQFRDESGVIVGGVFTIWTGSNTDGTKHQQPLGNQGLFVSYGDSRSGNNHLSDGGAISAPDDPRHLYALSPVFEVPPPTYVWMRGLVTVDVCKLNGDQQPASVCESDNNSAERLKCKDDWLPDWAKVGATPRAQVSQADINAARASVDAICNYNASAAYVPEVHGRGELSVSEGGAAARITVGLSKRLASGQTVTVPLTASGVADADYTIALRSGAGLNSGVALNTSNPYSAARPAVVFTGHATNRVQFASLSVSGVSDSANEGSETLRLGIGTVTNTNLTAGTLLHPNHQTVRVQIRDASSALQNAQAPTEAVANVQVTAVDDARASVTWDAVEHATSYYVSWSAESGDSLNASAGSLPGVTGTSTTIRHDASVPMTLTVTITPEYIDENGDTQQLDSLAGTATLEVGPTDGLIGSGGGTNGGGDGDAVQAGEGESPGAASFALPVAHWRFDGDALDWAGSSHGTVGGGAAFAANDEGEGVGSHALVLDGSDDYMDLASHVSNFPLGDAARSVTGWFKADAGNQRQTFFTYGPNVAGQRFSIAADRTQVLVGVSGHAWGVNGLDLAEGWHHVAVTYAGGDSDSISIYLDGALQAASTLVGAPQALDTQPGSPGSSPAAIGRNADGGAHYEGSIDDVRIYAAALNAEQVLALFDEHPQTPPPTTTAVTATATPALAEGNLDGADVELTLDAGAFAATVATSDITASGVSGVGVSSVTRDSDSQATATLAFDGTDFDADATLTLTVSADVLAHSDTDLSATLPVTAVDEPPPPPPPPPAVSIAAPVAHWKFDGDADDSAGSSNGSAMNGASFTTAASVGSHALSLDGSDDHVALASHVSNFPLGNSARSVTGWFRAEAGNQRQTFFTYGPNVEGKRLSIAADRTQALVAVSGHAWGVNNLSLADGWHHVAVTFAGGDSDDFSIYLNGALQSASTLGGVRRQVDTQPGSPGSSTAAIGQNVSGEAHYGGDIDDVRLYDYALSAEQVQAIAGRQETASAQDGAQATAAMPGGLLPAPLALPRTSAGADGTGAGGFDASLVNGTGSSFALESGDTPESDEAHNRSILPSDSRAPSLATTASATTATGRTHAPLVPGSSNPLREGLVQIVNPSAQGGEVQIVAIDDAGWRSAPVTLGIAAGASAQFTSRDLEQGNAAMGLLGSTGPGTGDWRLEMSSGLDVEVLPYVRTTDGTLSAMGDVAPVADNVHRVALFNPADSPDAASKLRLTNRGSQALRATITGIDDTGASPGGMVSVEIASDESVLLTAAELEAGGSNLLGALGDGEGQWRLDIASDGDLAVMNLAETSDGNLTNLSNATATTVPARKAHVVDRFPSSSDLSNEQGVVRIVNSSESPAVVRIEPNDSTGWRYAPLTLTLGANEAANLGTWDLELGNAAKGLSGNAGPGTGGAWRLAISSDSDIEVLTYTRAPNGLLTPRPGDAETEDKLR